MPSGSRKRKAKKKHVPTPSSRQGGEDLKHHGVEKSTEDVKNDDVQVEKDGGVQVDGESKKGDSFDEKKVDSSSSGSSSDSDDGSLEVEKKVMIVENAPVVELAEEDISISDGPIEVTHTTPVTKLDDSESVAGQGNILLQDEKVPVDSGPSIDSSITPDVEGNSSVLDEKVPGDSGASIHSSITPDVVELGQKENEEAKLRSLEESAKLPEVAKEPTPEDKDDKNASLLKEPTPDDKDDENASLLKCENIDVAATSDATESAVNKNEEKLTLSYNAPRVDATEDAEHSQARVTSVVRPDQSTSWKSCCGLFEAFTGTSR